MPEGIEGRVPYAGPLGDVVYQLVGGLRSGMGYAGAADARRPAHDARFMRVTTAGRDESHPHDVTITKEAPNYQRASSRVLPISEAQASFSTNASSWRRLRHSYTPSVWVPYSPTIESPVFQYDVGSGFSQYTWRALWRISFTTHAWLAW